jgi:hypothetical protein
MLKTWLLNFVEHHRSPEWIAAFALLIQAGIFLLHAWILRRHGKALDKNVDIANTQAKTGELMAKAMEQQGKILDDQSKIMNAQFQFQRRVTAQAEKEKVYDCLLKLRTSVIMLISKIEEPGDRYAPRVAEEQRLQAALVSSILPCQKAVVTSIHLTPEEREYFGRYIVDVSDLVVSTTNLPAILPKLKQLHVKYEDFLAMVAKVAQTPETF